jgi:DNA-binding SARP family transcriptional activator/Tfp pilus assembly protein PilF
MWFGILGPLVVRDGDAVVEVPAGRQRVLLAALLVHAGKAVPADALTEMMWDGAPPTGAAGTLRSHVSRLRRVLGPEAGARVLTRYPGYLVQAAKDEVDLLQFTGLCGEGGAAVRAGAWEQASELLGAALGLWRGDPLADVRSELLHRQEVPAITQLRLQALEWRIDAELHLGRHRELVAELQSLAARQPLREHFHAQLMLALYRCDRQAEALAAYQDARQVLIEELGTEPGTVLRELHQRMLAADPALVVADPAPPAAAIPVVPRELPARVRNFTGRATELAALTGLLDEVRQETAGTVVVSAIGGTAGVGKTALAVHWAYQVAGRFPDGQLYVNLRGYDPAQPMTAGDALAGFLRGLGVGGQDIPAEEAERAARYRSLLADRRMLVVLDNASEVEQVRPLLPGAPSCCVVVTSRDALTGLVARDGARRLDLDLLPLDDAVRLLRELIGDRADTDPDATAALAGQCCHLPLALRVAAELAAVRPEASLRDLVGELADQQRRLGLLDAGGDPRTAVRAVFSWSCRYLDSAAARAFRLAGLHPGPDLEPYAVAALTGTTVEQARRTLDVLARAHLIQRAGAGRYGMHDLLRAYARELAAAHEGEEGQYAALTRLFDHYLDAVITAIGTLHPIARGNRDPLLPPAISAPPVTDPAAARAWLDAERATLVAVTVHTAEHGWPVHATQLAASLFRYLEAGSHYPEAIIIYTHARRAASYAGDPAAEANALTRLGVVDHKQGRYQQAISQYQQALTLLGKTDDLASQGRALGNLGNTYATQGRNDLAGDHHLRALALFRQAGDQSGEVSALINLGDIDMQQGHYLRASNRFQQALAMARAAGERITVCYALINLGTVGLRQGRYRQAAGHLYRALALCRETGFRLCEAEALTRTGDLCLRQGHLQEAAGHLGAALVLWRQIGNRSGEADALNSLGEMLLAAGRPGDARSKHNAALRIAGQIGDRYQQARAHNGLGQAHDADGDLGQACSHWQEALGLYTELGVPEADQVSKQLAKHASPEPP